MKINEGWYISGDRAWFWDESQNQFTDWLDENGYQLQYLDIEDSDADAYDEELREATRQAGNVLTILDGPYSFNECYNRMLS